MESWVVVSESESAALATSIASLDAMDAAFDRLPPETRVVILAGAGKAFCAGLDLSEVQGTPETMRTLLRRLSEVMRRIRRNQSEDDVQADFAYLT